MLSLFVSTVSFQPAVVRSPTAPACARTSSPVCLAEQGPLSRRAALAGAAAAMAGAVPAFAGAPDAYQLKKDYPVDAKTMRRIRRRSCAVGLQASPTKSTRQVTKFVPMNDVELIKED